MPKTGMPMDLVLVRHGESEGNVALNASKEGDNSYFDIPGFRERAGYDWRLTLKGMRQAKAAGEVLRSRFPKGFDRYYVSDFARAKETAALLDLPNAVWFLNIYLHEQLWGRLDVMPRNEMEEKFPGAHELRNRHRFYGAYPDGEWMGEVCLRCDRILETLGRECSGRQVILVCHGNVIWAFRLLLERIAPAEFHRLDTSKDPVHQIANGQIEQYTRRNPETGEITDHFSWKRWDRTGLTPFAKDWTPIHRPSFYNRELLVQLESLPRLIEQ